MGGFAGAQPANEELGTYHICQRATALAMMQERPEQRGPPRAPARAQLGGYPGKGWAMHGGARSMSGSGSDGEASSGSEQGGELSAALEEAVHSGSLQLSSRMLTVVPSALWTCAGLVRLDLSSNALPALPAQLAELRALEALDVSWNKLAELPGELGGLPRLAELRAAYNHIAELPPQVAALPSLTLLDLSDNKLESLPRGLCANTSLQSERSHRTT
eukprot:jgi/Tetstr1/464498/TSEL_009256.t1